jgi:4-hydroxybenzoate polyprenyltransferase
VGVVKEYVKLIRPYGILFLGFTPVFGALCNGDFNALHLSILLIIGLLAHVFTFVQNDYYDMEVDRQSKYVVQRPLTSGVISRSHAAFLFLCSFFITVILAAFFFFSLRSFFVLLGAFFFVSLYNKYSKRISGMEFVLGAAVFLFGLFGALTVSDVISPLALIIACVGFLQWVFSVGVSANLKDVEFDTKLGIRTTPVVFGVKVVQNKLKKPVIFTMYAFGIDMVHIIVAFLPFLLGYTLIMINSFPLPILCFLLVALMMIFTTGRILIIPLVKRDIMLRYEGIHEGLALLLIPLVLMTFLIDNVGIIPTLLLFLLFIGWPLISLRTLYGKNLIPLE